MTTPEQAREMASEQEFRERKYIAEALRDLANQVERLEAQRKELREALDRLLKSDKDGAIANATEDDLCYASNDSNASPIVREQAAAVLQARAALKATQ